MRDLVDGQAGDATMEGRRCKHVSVGSSASIEAYRLFARQLGNLKSLVRYENN